jgi:hypothetical protein
MFKGFGHFSGPKLVNLELLFLGASCHQCKFTFLESLDFLIPDMTYSEKQNFTPLYIQYRPQSSDRKTLYALQHMRKHFLSLVNF